MTRMSSAYELVGYCLLLDGASLTMQDGTRSAVAQRAGDAVLWEGAISRDGPHELGFIAWMRGTGDLEDYRFDVKSIHDFVLTGEAAPAISVVLFEKPDEPRLERRPMLDWQPKAGMARPPGWKPPE
jgi:hypothetical protein